MLVEWIPYTAEATAITGEINEREHTGMLRPRTRRTGRFAYRVTLRHEVDGDNINASLADGVLTIHIPKAEQGERREIQITPP
jgi:HSP20 family protein